MRVKPTHDTMEPPGTVLHDAPPREACFSPLGTEYQEHGAFPLPPPFRRRVIWPLSPLVFRRNPLSAPLTQGRGSLAITPLTNGFLLIKVGGVGISPFLLFCLLVARRMISHPPLTEESSQSFTSLLQQVERVSRQLHATSGWDALLYAIADGWRSLFPYSITLARDAQSLSLRALQTHHPDPRIANELSARLQVRPLQANEGRIGQVISVGQPYGPSQENPDLIPLSLTLSEQWRLRLDFIIPLRVENETMGVLCAGSPEDEAPLPSEWFPIACLIGHLAEHSLSHARREEALRAEQRRFASQRRLEEIARAVTQSLEPNTVLQMVRDAVVDALGFDRAGVFIVESGTGAVRGVWGTDMSGRPEAIHDQVYSPDNPEFFGQIVRRDIPFHFQTDGDQRVHACFPFMANDQVVGILAVDNYITHHPIALEDVERLRPFCDQAAVAIRNARLHERILHEVNALHTLQEMTNEVRATTDPQTVLTTLVHRARELCGASECSVFLRRGPNALVWYRGAAMENRHLLALERGDSPVLERDVAPVAFQCLDQRTPVLLNGPNDPRLTAVETEWMRSQGMETALGLPLYAGAELYGILILFHRDAPRPFTDEEIALLQSLTDQGAVALQKARLLSETEEALERANDINLNLRRAFVPHLPLHAAQLDIGHRFEPAARQIRLGGDFYDLFGLGRSRYGIIMGDVAGHGLDAAVQTAAAKYLLRAFAERSRSTATAMKRLNLALLQQFDAPSFASLFYGILDTQAGTLTYTNAGHELPHLMLPNDAAADDPHAERFRFSLLTESDPVLAVQADVAYHSHQVPFPVGARLALYTDGVTEARRDGEFLLSEGVTAFLRASARLSSQGMADAVWERTREFCGHPHDDVAILVLHRNA